MTDQPCLDPADLMDIGDVCPRSELHEPWPAGFFASASHALKMVRTHKQRLCPGCGTWRVWLLKNTRQLAPEERDKRFWLMVDKAEGCWPWTGHTGSDNGYGIWHTREDGKRKVWRAHIYSYISLVGPVPDGLTLDHLCHAVDTSCEGGPTCPHRRCVNPEHMEPVPRGVNVLRGVGPAAMNARKTHCPNDHEYTPENTRINKYGYRSCRSCNRLPFRAYGKKKIDPPETTP